MIRLALCVALMLLPSCSKKATDTTDADTTTEASTGTSSAAGASAPSSAIEAPPPPLDAAPTKPHKK